MSTIHRNPHSSSGQTYASYTHRSTAASAIPTAINAATATVLSATAIVSGNSTATTIPAAAPEKRGRGRPRKTPVETTNNGGEDDSSSASENAPEVAPRKRGRPPKLNKVIKPPVDPSVPKRGRGRPRKNPPPTDASATGVSGSASASSSTKASTSLGSKGAGHHSSTTEPPRKRGRPRKQ
ncbi:MAG: hypothetical protein JOS17DRAFT_736477 [Linnemannia elongata]|nr:MAG: hypothetical protein JOS17DRAFT_736477 [Linnemannia elongata]